MVQETLDLPPVFGGPQGITKNPKLSLKNTNYPYIYKQNTSFILYIQTLIWSYLDSQIAQFGYLGGMGYRVWGLVDTRCSGLALRWPHI